MPDSASSYLSGLVSDGSGYYDQPNANWWNASLDSPDTYLSMNTQGGDNFVDWSQMGYDGPAAHRGEAQMNSGGEIEGVNQHFVPDEFKQFVKDNNYGLLRGQADGSTFQLSQLTKDGRPVRGASNSFSLPDPSTFQAVSAIVNSGLMYGAGLAYGGDYGASAGYATDATGATVGAGSAGAGYGAAGYSAPSYLSTVGSGAGKGALMSGGNTLMQGGDWQDVLKSAGYGALGGGIGAGVSGFNPGSYVTDNSQFQNYINKGITSGVNAGIRGGDVGQALAGSALMSGADYAGNQIGGALSNYFKPQATQGSSMPDYGYSSAPDSPVASYFNDMRQQSSAPTGFTNSDEVNSSLGVNTDNSTFNPDFSSFNTGSPQMSTGGNPFKGIMQQALGFGGARGEGGAGGINYGNVAGSLLGLYDAHRQKKNLKKLSGGLQDMFSPNSAYAKQMGQQLARRDAAAGRRSQYGPRAVELQARLAEMNSRNAPTLANIYGQQGQQQGRELGGLIRLGQQTGAFDAIGRGAQGLWNMYNQPSQPAGGFGSGNQYGNEDLGQYL